MTTPELTLRPLLFGAILTLAMAVPASTQFALGALGPMLTESLAMSRVEFGLLSATYFVSAALLSVGVGAVVDAVGGRRGLVALFIVSTVAFLFMAGAASYLWMLLAAGLAGASTAASNPVTNQLVRMHVPQGSRGTVIGIKQSGVWASAVVVGMLLPPIADANGWRLAVAATALPAAAGVALSLFAVPPDQHPVSRMRWSHDTSSHSSSTRWLMLYAFFMGSGGASITTYAALFAHEHHGASQVAAGWALSVMGASSVVARILWGRSAERVNRLAVPLTWLAVMATAAQVGLLGSMWLGLPLFWIAMATLGGSAAAWNAVVMVAVVRLAAPGQTGQASGVVLTGFYTGLVVGPVAFGMVVDASQSYALGWTLTVLLFLAALASAVRGRRQVAGALQTP